jgi:hypothetical protein
LFGLGVKHDPHVAEWLVGRLDWDTIEDGHGVGRADRDAGVGADDGQRDWRRRVLDAGDLEGWVKSSFGGAPQAWLVGAVMSDAQLVREEAEELRRRRVHTPGGGTSAGASPTEGGPAWLRARRGRWLGQARLRVRARG